jgi:hypothetical protein
MPSRSEDPEPGTPSRRQDPDPSTPSRSKDPEPGTPSRSEARHAVAQARSAPPPPDNTVLAVIYILVVHFIHKNNVVARNFTDTCWQMMILDGEAPQLQPLPNDDILLCTFHEQVSLKRHETDAMYTRWCVASASTF